MVQALNFNMVKRAPKACLGLIWQTVSPGSAPSRSVHLITNCWFKFLFISCKYDSDPNFVLCYLSGNICVDKDFEYFLCLKPLRYTKATLDLIANKRQGAFIHSPLQLHAPRPVHQLKILWAIIECFIIVERFGIVVCSNQLVITVN